MSRTDEPDKVGIGLANVLTSLRRELADAMASSAGERLRFSADSVDVQLSVVVTKSADGHAGVRFWVVDAGAGFSGSREKVQTVTIRLTPHDVTDGVIGTAYVGGASTPGEELPGKPQT